MCPQASVEFDSMSLTSAVVGRVMGVPLGGSLCPSLQFPG